MTTCFDILSRDITDITQDEVDELLGELQARQRTLLRQGVPPDEANAKASKSVQDDLKRAAALEKRNAALNLRIRRTILDEIGTAFAGDYIQGLESALVGSKLWKNGARYGVDQIQESLKRKYVGGFVGDLQRLNLVRHFSDGNLDLDIAKALHGLDDPAKLRGLSKDAIDIAKVIRKWQEVTRVDANKAGASIGKLPDYIVTQSHDTDRLVNAGFDKWYQDILPRLDIDHMFPNAGPTDVRKYLEESYKGIVSGIHEDIGGVEKMAAFKGPGNIAKRMSAERKLHFRDAETWFEYNQNYGVGNLREAVSVGLERMAETNGLMRKLGTNPEANFTTVVDELRQRLRDAGDYKKLRELDGWARGRGEGLYSVVSGKARSVVNDSTAAIWGTVRGIQNITKLGGAVLSAITDPFIAANSATHEGRNFFGTLTDQLLAPFGALQGEARRLALRELDYVSDGLIGQMSSRFSQQERLPGVMTKLQRWAFKLNLLQPHTDTQRAAAVLGTSGHLAALPDSFKELDDQTKRMLGNYGLTEKHWPILKEAVKDYDNYTVMSPQGVREMDSRSFAGLVKDRINQVKTDTAERIQKRMRQDQKEQEWVKGRAEKLREKMDAALAKLNERQKTAEGRTKEIADELQKRLMGLYSSVDTSNSYWQTVRDRIPSVAKVAQEAVRRERAGVATAGIEKSQAKAAQDLLELKASADVRFTERWDARLEKLNKSLEKSGNEIEADARLGDFDQAFTEANAAITERMASADEATAKRLGKLKERLTTAQDRFNAANKSIEAAKNAAPTASELRRAGVSEGQAKAAAKDIRSDVRQLTRDLERFKKETGEDFIDKWASKQDDFLAFSDGVESRMKERAEATNRDIVNLDPAIKRILDDAKEDTATRLQTLIYDRMNYSVISPTARTTYFSTGGGASRGTVVGEAARTLMQFKSFSIAFWQNSLQQELYSRGASRWQQAGAREALGVAQLMVMMTGLGYVSMTLKDWAKGKSARPVDNPATWMASAVQGGGAGIYGDFLFGEANRFGASPIETLAGPTAADAAELLKIAQSLRDLPSDDSDLQDAGAKALKFGVNHTPFLNLFYTKLLMDHLFLYNMQEQLNPGYLRRMERRVEKQTGAEWNIRPTEAAR